jgi:hypothetical protein
MNCRDAREQLDAARPGPVDRSGAEFAAAMQHVGGCPSCRHALEGRERFDREVGRVMRDVTVPAGLKTRILDALQAVAPATAPADQRGPSAPDRLRTRRWLVAAAMTSAVALLAVVAVQFWPATQQQEAKLTLSDLRQQTTLKGLDALKPFDGNFAAKRPGGIWNRHGIRIDERAKGDLPDANGYHRVALYGLTVTPGNGRPVVHGVLLVIPKRQLSDPPSRKMPVFEDRAENYARRASGTYHSFAWQTDEFVYVCFVPKDSLQILQQVVSGPNA